MGDLGGAITLVQSGKIRALAVSGDKRMAGLPNVPTIKETHPEYENYAWTTFFVRSDTPPAVHAKLVETMKKALTTKESLEYFEKQNSIPMLTFGPDEMAKVSARRDRALQAHRGCGRHQAGVTRLPHRPIPDTPNDRTLT